MSTVIIMTAMEVEAKCLRRYFADRKSVHVMTTGMGKSRAGEATRLLLQRASVDMVLIAGLAGGLNPAIKRGQILEPLQVVDAETGITFTPPSLTGEGCLVTVSKPATSIEEKAALHARFGADAVDMESAAIVCACTEEGVPWRCARVISDSADEALPGEFSGLVKADGKTATFRAMGLMVRKPGLIGSMVRMGRQTQGDMGQLAEILDKMIESI